MSRVCQITKKGPSVGYKVSHSNRHTKRRFLVNLIEKRVFIESLGIFKKMRMSARAWRSYAKHGEAYFKKMANKAS